MGDVRREMENLRKNKKGMTEIRNTVIEMKNAFDGLISRQNMAKKECLIMISPKKFPKLKSKEEKKWNKKDKNIQKLWDNYKKYKICITGIPKKARKEQKKYLKQ